MTVSSIFWRDCRQKKTRIPEGIERVRNADSTREICCSILWQTSVERSHCFGNNACRRIPFFPPRSFFHESRYDELAIKHRISVYTYIHIEREREKEMIILPQFVVFISYKRVRIQLAIGWKEFTSMKWNEKYKTFFL